MYGRPADLGMESVAIIADPLQRLPLELQLCSILFYVCVELVRNPMAHAQKPDFVFRLNGRVHLNRREIQFSRLLAAEVCASALVMLDTPRSEVV